jgi:hypothetical protein
LPGFSCYNRTKRGKYISNGRKHYQQDVPNGCKIDQMAIKYKYQHLPLQDSPNFTQIGIFGLKIHHLATLITYLPTNRVEAN